MHGIPWGAKDLLDTAGIPTTYGAEPYRNRVPREDAAVVRLLHDAGAVLAGGHSTEDEEPKFGLSVTGLVHPDKIWRNVGAQVGDRLLLPKPLGSGVLFNANRRGWVSQPALQACLDVITTLNRRAAEVLADFTVHACTDVTGFGLGGHGYGMAKGTQVTLAIDLDAVPVMDEALEMYRRGVTTGVNATNRAQVQQHLRFERERPEWEQEIVFDPQTSGGLLAALPAAEAERALAAREVDGIVYGTGANTYFGKTAQLVQDAHTVSHFQRAVLTIGNYLIYIAVALVALILVVALSRGDRFATTLQFALVLTVAAIPVAMPTVLSVTMAVGARLLAAKQAIVSRLASIEELAGMDLLCSDKTGTLTQNTLTLGEPYSVPGVTAEQVVLSAALASRAEDGDTIDTAVLSGVKDPQALRGMEILSFQPFDPVHKRTEATVTGPDGRTFKVTKGAAQVILALAGAGGGVLLAVWGVPLLVSLAGSSLPRLQEVSINLSVLGTTVVVAGITGVLFGLIPALQSLRGT